MPFLIDDLIILGAISALGAGAVKVAKGPPDAGQHVFGGRRRRGALFGYLNDQPTAAPQYAPPSQAHCAPPQRQVAGAQGVVIPKDGNCFRARCSIADVSFNGIIDTGAAACVIPRKVISDLGVDLRSIQYDTPFATPSGRSMAAVVPLPITVQGITIDGVECAVMQEDGGIKDALIGVPFLSKLQGGAHLRGDTMILKP